MLDYALASGDAEIQDFVQRSYEWARAQGEAIIVGARSRKPAWPLGCFPETSNTMAHETVESCEVADMVGIALKLAATGLQDCWDDVDGWIRNQFAESQLVSTDWLHELSATYPRSGPAPPGATDRDVIERNRGAFAGWAMPNAWMNHLPESRTQIMHCCTGNGAQAIYYIWEHILHQRGDKVRVNLLLNRASPWVDVDSCLPAAGRVDIKAKVQTNLEVRIPGWVGLKDVQCQVDGRDRGLSWAGRHAQIGALKPGETVVLSFPVSERTEVLEYEKRRYEATFRGADCVAIDPPGVRGPFYQRQHYRSGVPQTRKVPRFVSSERIDW